MTLQLVKSLFGNKTIMTLIFFSFLMSCASKTHTDEKEKSEHLKETSTYQR